MIQRSTAYNGESEVQLLQADMGSVFDELNKGLDPNQLPQGKITLDKLRVTTPSTGTKGYAVGSVQIPAGDVQIFNVSFSSPVSGQGLAAGQYYPVTLYADFFVDPTGTPVTDPVSGAVSIANIYSGNATWNATGIRAAKIVPSVYLNNSANVGAQLFIATVVVHNADSSAHWVYVVLTASVINTQASTAQ